MELQLILCAVVAVALLGTHRCAQVELKLSKCKQSSEYNKALASCEKAIDGNPDKKAISVNSCAKVGFGIPGWWQAETEQRALIDRVEMSRRESYLLLRFRISVDGHVCYEHDGSHFFVRSLTCYQKGTVLKIESDSHYMKLCEVKAFGSLLGDPTNESLPLSRCKQSSELSNSSKATCEKAIDGNTSQSTAQGSCSRVGGEATGWWKAETDRPALIKYVRIYNRKDCCAERLSDFTISVDGDVCYAHDGTAFSVKSFRCYQRGAVLKIDSKKKYLTLCEVKAFGSLLDPLKLWRCQQSSDVRPSPPFWRSPHICIGAIDGITNQHLGSFSCSHVGSEATGWWKADTGRPALIEFVQIYNRLYCCPDRLTNFTISVDDKVCYDHDRTTFSVEYFPCYKRGTVLKIYSRKPYLTLCEVKAFGFFLDILNMSNCVQSSNISSSSNATCEKAIDGDTRQNTKHNSCSRVGSEASGWWKAETDRPALMEFVQIYNRQDCCADNLTDFTISVDDKVCYDHDGTTFSVKYFPCYQRGTVLKIDSKKQNLTLCEVKAFGSFLDTLNMSRCKQSSELSWSSKATCEKAIDGDTNQDARNNRCSHLGGEATGWWKVEIDKPAMNKYVKIYNRKDCCAERLSDFKISVDNKVCYDHDGTTFSVKYFQCFKYGTVVKIDSKKQYMALCEVKVLGHYLVMTGEPTTTRKSEPLPLSRCNQSSELSSSSKATCEKAIDGDTNQDARNNRCSHLGGEATGWWKAGTGKPAMIKYVKIYNRKDCCAERLSDFKISVDGDVCYNHDGNAFSVSSFRCYKRGAVLKIDSKKQYMTLCEVKAFGSFIDSLNMSNCKQSSDTSGSSNATCEKAIDGDTRQNTKHNSCSRVGSEATGWWKAETERPALMEFVQIYNRQDCCADRLTDFKISVDDKVCYNHDGTTFSVKYFQCLRSGMVVKIDSKKQYLTLCEVKVLGHYLDILKLSRCQQSSEFGRKATCDKAIDSDTRQNIEHHSCSHLGGAATGWWKAETDKPALMEFVQIYNRQDCCTDRLADFTISVDDKVCYDHDGTTFSVKYFPCYQRGTVLKIDSRKQYLTICEVKVFGSFLDTLNLSRCQQSSEFGRKATCDKAIDGDTRQNIEHHSCSHLGGAATGWWKAETEKPALMEFVQIYNRQDCCADRLADFKISVDDVVCYDHDGTIFSVKYFQCSKPGTVVKIASNKQYLTLCEVKVLGHYLDASDWM